MASYLERVLFHTDNLFYSVNLCCCRHDVLSLDSLLFMVLFSPLSSFSLLADADAVVLASPPIGPPEQTFSYQLKPDDDAVVIA